MSLLSARLSPALVLLVVLLIFFPYVRRVLVLVGVFFFRSVTVSVLVECKFEIESLFNYEANNCKYVCLSLLRQ